VNHYESHFFLLFALHADNTYRKLSATAKDEEAACSNPIFVDLVLSVNASLSKSAGVGNYRENDTDDDDGAVLDTEISPMLLAYIVHEVSLHDQPTPS
jgi:hypothetical protein